MEKFILFLKGILMGVANIIPGVSGGTLAVSLNIFDELIKSINDLFKNPKKSLSFLIPIFLGIGFGILAFSSLIEYGLTNASFMTNMFFVGLIVGSIPLIYGKAVIKGHSYLDYALCAGVFILMVFMTLESGNVTESAVTETVTFSVMIKYFLIGIVASSAMIVPGISGSFLLMTLGVYNTIIFSISNLVVYLKDVSNISLLMQSLYILVPTGLGIVIGIFLVSKIIVILLEKAQTKLYFCVLGLIFGSIFAIFYNPLTYQSGINITDILIGGIMFILGGVISKNLGGK